MHNGIELFHISHVQETAMTTNLPASTTTCAGLSMELERLLSANATPEAAASAAIEAGVIEEFRAALSGLYSDAARGAGLDGIVSALTPWFATFPQPERSDAEWSEWWAQYTAVCGYHSQAALAGAMREWAKKPEAEFMPKPGALSELARTTPTAAFRLAARVHNILQIADDRTDRRRVLDSMEHDGVKPEDQVAAVAQLLAEFNTRNEPARDLQDKILRRGVKYASAERVEELPYIGGECATGSALTPQMHHAMGWPVPPPRDPREPAEFDGGI